MGTYSIDLKGISGCFWFEHRQLEAFVQKLALTMLVPGMTCQKERVVLIDSPPGPLAVSIDSLWMLVQTYEIGPTLMVGILRKDRSYEIG